MQRHSLALAHHLVESKIHVMQFIRMWHGMTGLYNTLIALHGKARIVHYIKSQEEAGERHMEGQKVPNKFFCTVLYT